MAKNPIPDNGNRLEDQQMTNASYSTRAMTVTRHQLSAGLYAPIRVLLREDAAGAIAFEY